MNANADRTDGHLDEIALDALRAGEGCPEHAAHAAACPHCRAALAGLSMLEERLKAAQPPIPEVPGHVEFRIFRAYRDSCGKREPFSVPSPLRRWGLPAAGLAAAAALTLTLRLTPPPAPVVPLGHVGPSRRIDSVRPGGSGKELRESARVAPAPSAPAVLEAPQPTAAVDIVDAFRLARALRDGRQVAPGWDTDGDGRVDRADVRAVAHRAVAL